MSTDSIDSIYDEVPSEDAGALAVDAADDHAAVEIVAEKPAKKAAVTARTRKPSPDGQAVSGGSVDTVSLAAIVYKNPYSRKSLSVHHVQRRLAELGYPDAYTDKDGWYGDLTKAAVAAFQADEGLAGDGVVDMDTLIALFHDDSNVEVAD